MCLPARNPLSRNLRARWLLGGCLLFVLLLAVVWRIWPREPVRSSGPMPHQAYVWQRSWGPQVSEAIGRAEDRLAGVVVLVVEVSWQDGRSRVATAEWDPILLSGLKMPVGLAIRIGPFEGPFRADDDTADLLTSVASGVLNQARNANLPVAELQVDFDCAESKLSGYRTWVEAIRRRASPTPVVITALPSWLRQSAFRTLAEAADGFVLQVHSLERPKGPDAPMTLCDPTAARHAVETAARVGRPFRVALPTYGYTVAFDQAGKFIGLSAEGPMTRWPQDASVIEVRSDPAAMADLVQAWTDDRPMNLQGIIWYRLPTDKDALNWRWPTLECIMTGRCPLPAVRVELRRPEAGLVKIDLVNDGQADSNSRIRLRIACGGADLIAGDALGGFQWKRMSTDAVVVESPEPPASCVLAVGQRRTVAWLRLDDDKEVRVEIEMVQP